MRCDEAQRSLSEYIDGALSGERALLVEQHLQKCSLCREVCDSMREIAGYMAGMESVDPPAGFVDRVNARLAAQRSLTGSLRRIFTPVRIKLPLELAGVAAAVVLIFYVSQFNLREKTADQPAGPAASGAGVEEPRKMEGDPGVGAERTGGQAETPVLTGRSEAAEDAGKAQEVPAEKIELHERGRRVVSESGADSEGMAPAEDQDLPAPPAVASAGEESPGKKSDAPFSGTDEASEVKEKTLRTVAMASPLVRQPRRMDVDGWRLRINELGGEIIDIQPPDGVSDPDSAAVPVVFSIEIPAKNHQLFLAELEKFKSIHKISAEVTGTEGDTLKIRMVIEDLP